MTIKELIAEHRESFDMCGEPIYRDTYEALEQLRKALKEIVELWQEEGDWCHRCHDDKADDMGRIADEALAEGRSE